MPSMLKFLHVKFSEEGYFENLMHQLKKQLTDFFSNIFCPTRRVDPIGLRAPLKEEEILNFFLIRLVPKSRIDHLRVYKGFQF